MEAVRSASLAERRFTLLLVAAFGLVALLLAAVGVYGVVALVVAERTAELGLRVALGAAPLGVARLVVGEALQVTAVGLVAGLVAAAGVARLMSSQLFAVPPARSRDLRRRARHPRRRRGRGRRWRRRGGRCGSIRCARCTPADERTRHATNALIAALLALLAAPGAAAHAATARLAVTQRALLVQCVDGAAVPADRRSWTVSAPVTLAVTMRNQPRPGMAPAGDSDPGTAIVRFTPEPGHRYEVEVRADPTTFSTRVWPKGAWLPVVRDRTTERIVSGDPEWAAPPCAPQAR